MAAHKIPGVSKIICTAEQMITYNYCRDYYNLNGGKDLAMMHCRSNSKLNRYDKELICNLIETRFDDYCISRGPIFSSYEQVGNFFFI